VSERWLETVPVLDNFTQVADPSRYAPLPDDWLIGVSDVVDSTSAIDAGRYKAVNLAGAATISAVANALSGDLPLFVFGGDGARFAVAPMQERAAADALSRVAMWAERDLRLHLRVGMTSVAEARTAGFDVRVAFWQTSDHVRYAMFSGGAMEWAEAQLKSGAIGLLPAAADDEPDLTGLSCQWGPIVPTQGKILSLIVKPARGASEARFAKIASTVITALEEVPTGLIWLVFKLGVRIGRFDPDRYRREIAVNTDFRKFDDALMMTVDCSPETAVRLRAILDEAAAKGVVRYGLHTQDEALMTCVVSSVLASDHMHFVDGAGGGYASAARQLRRSA
jgi:hypothetical protein